MGRAIASGAFVKSLGLAIGLALGAACLTTAGCGETDSHAPGGSGSTQAPGGSGSTHAAAGASVSGGGTTGGEVTSAGSTSSAGQLTGGGAMTEAGGAVAMGGAAGAAATAGADNGAAGAAVCFPCEGSPWTCGGNVDGVHTYYTVTLTPSDDGCFLSGLPGHHLISEDGVIRADGVEVATAQREGPARVQISYPDGAQWLYCAAFGDCR